MAKLTYAEQLLHPKWQRKRLEMLDAAGWACSSCGATDVTLHVHHKEYVRGRMAWEYDAAELVVLCKTCHANGHAVKDGLKRLMALNFAKDVSVEDFAFGFLAGMLAPFGGVDAQDFELALTEQPRFFGMGYFICALGPSDITAAVRRKRAEGRLPGENDLLDTLLKDEESEPPEGGT